MKRLRVFLGVIAACVAPIAAGAQDGEDRFQWPSFRGPSASGVADGQNPPTEWNAVTGRNVAWSTPIPGLGHSSPVIWDDRIFVTTAVSDNPNPVFRYGTDGRIDRRSDRERNTWFVYAMDRRGGDVLWVREAISAVPEIRRHPKNSYASATPATDGEHLAVLVATGHLFLYDMDGNLLWEADLGPLDSGASYDDTYQWGAASSPIIWRDFVIVQADQQDGSFIAAFDKGTGAAVWKTTRDLISAFSTPTVHVGPSRAELITNGAGTMFGYDPATGAELWRMSGSSFNTTPTPVVDDGLIYLTSGYRIRPIFAVRVGATGDISLDEGARANEHVVWSSPRDGPYMSSPLVYQGYLYVVSTNGVLTAFDARTGERAYKTRIAQRGGAYTASPIAADGRIYLTSEDGDIFVIRAGPEYELLTTNPMDEVCLATPAISEGQFIVRTTRRLVALQDGIEATLAAGDALASAPFPQSLAADARLPFDDFEDGDLFGHTGVRWHTFTNGISTADLTVSGGGADATTGAAQLSGELAMGAERGPLAQMYQQFDRGGEPVNLGNLGGVRFHARGNRAFELALRCSGVDFGTRVEVDDSWRIVEIAVGDLRPVAVPEDAALWDGDRCTGLYLSRRGESDLGDYWFEVDELTLYGEEAWETRPAR